MQFTSYITSSVLHLFIAKNKLQITNNKALVITTITGIMNICAKCGSFSNKLIKKQNKLLIK